MYLNLKRKFWWCGMKKNIAEYVVQCLSYQLVKAGHQRSIGKLQSLKVPTWKWDQIAMDIFVGLPKAPSRQNAIWIIVD